MTPISIIANGSFCLGRGIDQRITFADSIARYNYVWKRTTRRSYFSIKIYRPKFKFKKKKNTLFRKKNIFKILYIYIFQIVANYDTDLSSKRMTSKGKLQSFVPWADNHPRFASVYKRSIVARASRRRNCPSHDWKWKFSSRSKDFSDCGGIHLERLGIPVETTVNKS